MKNQIKNFALVAAMIGAIAAGCSSSKQASGSDSTKVDTATKMSTPTTDTTKKDTVKTDTGKVKP